jgi:hypothetical protein
VLTYITMLALTLGTMLIFIFWTVVASRAQDANFGAPRVAPEQLLYPNPGVAMIDVIAPAEPGGGSSLANMLAQLRGSSIAFDGEVRCIGDVCENVDPGPLGDVAVADSSGYWWSRIAITYLLASALLTYLATRLVVPAGMRWAFRRRRPRQASAASDPGPMETSVGAPTIEELDR